MQSTNKIWSYYFSLRILLLFAVSVIFTNSCKKNKLSIGDSYGGGIIAYILVSGDPGYSSKTQHGLIAAPSDQSNGLKWYNGGLFMETGAIGTAIGAGSSNTNTIIASQGTGDYAAQLCADLELGGYSDWYLPSIDELSKLYENKTMIGGFIKSSYWSSSENNKSFAFMKFFDITGTQLGNDKSFKFCVEVRTF